VSIQNYLIRRSRSIELLASLILLIVVISFLDLESTYGVVISLLFAFVLLTAIRVVTDEGQYRRSAYILAILWLALSSIGIATQQEALRVVTGLLFIAFTFLSIGVILRRIVAAIEVDSDVISYSISTYLLTAIAWAVSYELIYVLEPESFRAVEGGSELTLNHFIYFSLTTITTLGYGDITPASVPVGIWAALEAATGVFYIAILVARLVSMYRH
jgi:Ion channel